MDPLLVAANLIVALMGVALMALAQRVPGRVLKFVTGLAGLALLALAILNLPGKTLSGARTSEVSPPTPEPMAPQEQSSADTDKKIIYVGDLDALAQALWERMSLSDKGETPKLELETPLPERDPFVVPALPRDPPLDPPPAPAPASKTPERTLPQETSTPSCTSFELLHGTNGGPEPDGCYAVGCQEGYALPMELVGGAWNACLNYSRLPRLKDCYIITDHDGSQRSMRFTKGSWKPGTCSP